MSFRRPPLTRILERTSFDEDGCWRCDLNVSVKGYSMVGIGGNRPGSRIGSHRYMYEAARGPIPEGLVINHICRTRNCVNPDHLEVVTHADNILQGAAWSALNARKTACKRGHPFDERNTIIRRDGSRDCRECRLTLHGPKQRARRKALVGA